MVVGRQRLGLAGLEVHVAVDAPEQLRERRAEPDAHPATVTDGQDAPKLAREVLGVPVAGVVRIERRRTIRFQGLSERVEGFLKAPRV